MITAPGILKRAIQLLTHDPLRVARILLPALLASLLFIYAKMSMPVMDPAGNVAAPEAGAYLILMIATVIAGALLLPWSAVAFHRYVLRDEVNPGLVPPLGKIFGYLGRSLLISLLILLSVAVLMFGSAATGSIMLIVLASLAASFLSYWLTLRMGLILPAISVDSPMSIRESMRATKPINSTTILIAIILSIVGVLAARVPIDHIGTVVGAIIWLIQIAILTTLYGHLIEDRPLETQ